MAMPDCKPGHLSMVMFVEPASVWPEDEVVSDPGVVEEVAKNLSEYLAGARSQVVLYEQTVRTAERTVLVKRAIVGGRAP